MGYLVSEKPPEKWSAAFFKMYVERLRIAVNNIDANNFPEGLDGNLLNESSVWYTKLYGMGYLTKLKDLSGIELQNTIFALAEPFTIASATLTNVGGYILYDETLWNKENVQLMFEVVGASYDATSVATFELYGVNGMIAQVTVDTGDIEWKRSEAFTAPTDGQTLLVKAKTSDAAKPASVLSARLIIKIQ